WTARWPPIGTRRVRPAPCPMDRYPCDMAEHFGGSVGLRGHAELTVGREDTAAHASGGALPAVLSTPRLLQLVEDATHTTASRHLEPGYTSAGFEVVLEHLAPSEVGDSVVAHGLLA